MRAGPHAECYECNSTERKTIQTSTTKNPEALWSANRSPKQPDETQMI